MSWVNGPDSHFGITQELKYKIIVAQDIVGVKWNKTICSGFLSSPATRCLLWNGGRRANRLVKLIIHISFLDVFGQKNYNVFCGGINIWNSLTGSVSIGACFHNYLDFYNAFL